MHTRTDFNTTGPVLKLHIKLILIQLLESVNLKSTSYIKFTSPEIYIPECSKREVSFLYIFTFMVVLYNIDLPVLPY